MIERFLGLMKIEDESSVMETLIEHARLDHEEIQILSAIGNALIADNQPEMDLQHQKIQNLSIESKRIFQHTPDQIINAEFDYKKQYDLLRLYQRNEGISGLIMTSAKRLMTLTAIGGTFPEELHAPYTVMIDMLIKIHLNYKITLQLYLDDKHKIIPMIATIDEIENEIDIQRAECLKILYTLANENKLRLGDFRAIEDVVEHIEEASDVINEAASSLEWLLIDLKTPA